MTESLDDLVRDVDLLCLDAGNTVVFLDHARLAGIVREALDFDVSPSVLVRAEGEAKRLAESAELVDAVWAFRDRPGAAAWGRMVGTITTCGGVDRSNLPRLLDRAWAAHEEKNLWSDVPPGLPEALREVRRVGVRVVIVSNSEGMLDRLFGRLGILDDFDLVIDSGKVGVEKPDPRIFAIAIDRFGISPSRALHLGDVFATDIVGARAAGIRCALIDPHLHYANRHPDVPRVDGVVATARALVRNRRSSVDEPR